MLQANQLIDQAERAFERQEWREAIELYRKIPMKRGLSHSHKLNYFYALEQAGQPDAARNGYLDLSYRNPLNEGIHIETGSFFQRQEKPLEAAIFFGRALCVDAEAEPALQALEVLDISAREKIDHCCVMGGLAGENFSGARPSFVISIVIWPMIEIAMAAMRQQAWEKAERYFGKILKIEPNYVPMLVQLGHCLREQGRLEEALATYRRAILLSPRDADTYLHLGHTLKAMERHLSALNAYSTVLTLRPGLLSAHAEIETLRRFFRSRGISISTGGDHLERREKSEVSPIIHQSAMEPEPWLSDRQKIIFYQISNALTLRD